MERIFDQEQFAKNIYVIRHKLGELKIISGHRWEYQVGQYTVIIYPYDIGDVPPADIDNILKRDKVSVVLNERSKLGVVSSISLLDDPRFKNYEPIQYNVIESPGGRLNLSNGDNMPILHLCELIRYLHRLSNLTAFM
jgi:hypothetical protein